MYLSVPVFTSSQICGLHVRASIAADKLATRIEKATSEYKAMLYSCAYAVIAHIHDGVHVQGIHNQPNKWRITLPNSQSRNLLSDIIHHSIQQETAAENQDNTTGISEQDHSVQLTLKIDTERLVSLTLHRFNLVLCSHIATMSSCVQNCHSFADP